MKKLVLSIGLIFILICLISNVIAVPPPPPPLAPTSPGGSSNGGDSELPEDNIVESGEDNGSIDYCSNGLLDIGEDGIDCGGNCESCLNEASYIKDINTNLPTRNYDTEIDQLNLEIKNLKSSQNKLIIFIITSIIFEIIFLCIIGFLIYKYLSISNELTEHKNKENKQQIEKMEELRKYILTLYDKGYQKQNIINFLIQYKYGIHEIDKAFKEIENGI